MRSRRSWLPFGWGMLDQALSSGNTFLLTIVGARALGPHGLGIVVLGWTAYLGVLGLQRALVTRTLVATSSTATAAQARAAAARALTLVLASGAASSIVFLGVGLAVHGVIGEGLLLFTPWVAAALLQDFWRSLLFRDRRPAAAAMNDAAWFSTTAIAFAPALLLGSNLAVAAAWGTGAVVSALLGFAQTRLPPAPPGAAAAWWRRDAWQLSRWLGAEAVVYSVVGTATVIVLTRMLGATAIGALRAAQSLFAPLSILAPAVGLPGLPAVARADASSPSAGASLAARLSGAVAALTLLYVASVTVVAGWLMPIVFGDSFRSYQDLARPIGVWQLIVAAGIGFSLLLTARKLGRPLLLVRIVESLAILALAAALSAQYGLRGAAWGYAAGAAAGLTALGLVTVRTGRASGPDVEPGYPGASSRGRAVSP